MWCWRTLAEHWDVAPAGVTAKVPCGGLKSGFSVAASTTLTPSGQQVTGRVPAYIAHPLNAPTPEERYENIARAERWVCWLAERYLIAPVASWTTLGKFWPETPECRAEGLTIDRVLVELCGTIVLVGPRVSPGMQFEAGWARTVIDLTALQCEDCGLTRPCIAHLAETDRRMDWGGIARVGG